LGLIRLEFRNCDDKIAVAMAQGISNAAASNKPKLLDKVRDIIGASITPFHSIKAADIEGATLNSPWRALLPNQELFFSVPDHFAPDGALINASEALFHRRGEQRDVRNFAEMFGDEPDRFVRRHPVETVESGKIYRT
jgi:hypothetical protein